MKTKQKKLIPPDFSKSCGFFGGNLAEIPTPHIRMFGPHSTKKRKATLKVMSWVGTAAIGAKHVYASFEVEGNPIWNPIEGRWQKFWDDKEYESGWELNQLLRTEFIYKNGYDAKITAWVKKVVKAHLPADQFQIIGEDYNSIEPTSFVYKINGD